MKPETCVIPKMVKLTTKRAVFRTLWSLMHSRTLTVLVAVFHILRSHVFLGLPGGLFSKYFYFVETQNAFPVSQPCPYV